MISFKNNIKKSTLSFKVIVVCLLLSGSLISQGVAALPLDVSVPCTTGSFTINSLNVVTGNTACAGRVEIPDSVTSIGIAAFEYNSFLTSVIIPDSVTSIGDDAFNGNTALTSVTIGNSVTSIGISAFENNSSLTSVIIGNSVTTIGVDAFYGNTALTSVTIPDSVTSIGNLAFSVNTALTSLIIGNSVRNIGVDAFSHNPALTSVRFLGNAPTVGRNGFLDVAADATANVGYNATGFSEDGVDWEGLTVDVGSNQYRESWEKVSGALTADDARGKRWTGGDSTYFTFVDDYKLFNVPVGADISIYIKGNPNNNGTGLCDPALLIYDVTNTDLFSYRESVDDGGFGGSDNYDGKTCGQNYYDTFKTVSTVGIDVSNYRIQVTSTGILEDGVDPILNRFNSGTYTLYVSVGSFTINNDSGSDSSPTTKTITPVVVKNADSITNMKNKTYLSKYSMKLKLRENNLFKYSASDSFKYQVFKSSKKSCGMRGNYVMRYENSKTCDLYITRTNAKGSSNKYWVKINYLN